MAPMRDGILLATDLYRHADRVVGPVLVARTPYNKEGMVNPELMMKVQAGYHVMVQDTRDRFAAQGDFWANFQEIDVVQALARYEAERRPPTARLTLMNRQNGPEQVMQLTEERAPNGFTDLHSVISQQELAEIAACYKQTAGFNLDQVNR